MVDAALLGGALLCAPVLLWAAQNAGESGLSRIARGAYRFLASASGSDVLSAPMLAVIVVAAFVLEGLLLGYLGTTPGKALLGIRVMRADGGRLGFAMAIRRLSLIVLYGFGLFILAIFTLIASYNTVSETGAAKWDTRLKLVAGRARVSRLRWAAVAVIYFLATAAPSFLADRIGAG